MAYTELKRDGFGFVTLHRPSNVDVRETFRGIVEALAAIADELPAPLPGAPPHPRPHRRVRPDASMGRGSTPARPVGFKESLFLWKDAAVVLTDSGGLQEETTALGVPCVTIRENTERPITLEMGTNILAGTSPEGILAAYRRAVDGSRKAGRIPPLWDGRASERIWRALLAQDGQP